MQQRKVDIPSIIQENKRRLAALNVNYDPVTGEGSLIDRTPLFIMPHLPPILIPVDMAQKDLLIKQIIKTGSVYEMCLRMCKLYDKVYKDSMLNDMLDGINEIRLDYDFEYWAFMTVKITDKDTGEPVPFKLNLPQRILFKVIMREILSGKPVRIIITKARQWGGSTLTQIVFAWVQIRLKRGWNSLIVAHVQDQAKNIRAMYSRFAVTYPKELTQDKKKGLATIPYEGSQNTRYIKERDCIIGITSIENPDSTRSFDYAMCHLSEVGLWRGTLLKKPEDLVQNVRAGVKKVPMSFVVMESTAKGVGTFFHREWQAAKSKKSAYVPVFIPWHCFDKYTTPIEDDNYKAFINQLTDDDWHRWYQGAALEGIHWYNTYMAQENYDKWRMESEFPGDDNEAFQSTGNTVFHRRFIAELEKGCMPPQAKGRLQGDETTGKKALQSLQFETVNEGNLWVWEYPDKSIKVRNRYVVVMDIGGTTQDADYSVIRVIDRYWLIHGGVPVTVATWRGHIDQDLLAWIGAQIAEWYNHALFVVESNSLKKEQLASDGDHFLTVLDEISDVYDNIYTRTSPEKVREGAPVMWGFHTNTQTKQLVVDNLKAALRKAGYVETDMRAIDEMKGFQQHEDGTLGAVDGMHDDMVMATAIGLYVSDKQMGVPVEYVPVTREERNAKSKRRGVSEAVI